MPLTGTPLTKTESGPRTVLAWRVLAVSAAGAGTVGALLPLLPTTPFLLVALWAASRGSPELHRRIRAHRRFGPLIEAWQNERAVPTRAKALACALMITSLAMLWLAGAGGALLTMLAVLFAIVAMFLLSRPAPRQRRTTVEVGVGSALSDRTRRATLR